MKSRWGWIAALLMALGVMALPGRISAQEECPQKVLVALARAGAACQRMERGQACYGYGAVAATFQPGSEPPAFDAVGSLAGIGALRDLRVGGGEEWSIAALEIQADLVDVQQRSVTLLLFGDAAIENQVPYIPEVMISSIGTLYVREAPQPDAEIITRLGLRDTALANGRTQDGYWLRITIPGTNQLAWVSRDVLTALDDLNKLNIVDENTPFYQPFQVFSLRSGANDAPCDGAPASGLLIQTPNTFTPVTLVIDGATLRLAATVFLQTDGDTLTLDVLDGWAEIEAQSVAQYVPAGAQTRVSLDSAGVASGSPDPAYPYDSARVASLPVNNLPYRFTLPEPPAQDAIDTLVAAYYAPPPTPTPDEQAGGANVCVRKVHQNVSLWAGPGMFYEIVRPISAGTRVYPVVQVTDADNLVWWQLSNNNWLRADAVTSTGNCQEVPILTVVEAQAPRTNTLTLETCETSNGPIRVGQQVTIEFVPPAFETREEVLAALRVDPGRITVGPQRLRVYASNPIEIAEERFIRVFRGTWTAEAGTYRLTGQRLSYIVTCDITVLLGR